MNKGFVLVSSVLFFHLIKAGPVVDVNDLQCEKSNSTEARLGGPDACPVKPHSKPWMVVLMRQKIQWCGGTLISKSIVLTAAHCFCTLDLPYYCFGTSMVAVLGDHDIRKIEQGEQSYEIQSATPHKDWRVFFDDPVVFDVGIMILKEEAILNEYVHLASLPKRYEECPSGNSLTLSGWGKDPYNNDEEHFILWAVKQGCLNVEKCDRLALLEDKSLILCVGDEQEPNNSGYHGDSGGPLTYTDKDGKATVYGIVSGPGIEDPITWGRSVTVFTRVAHPDILHWITQAIKNNEELKAAKAQKYVGRLETCKHSIDCSNFPWDTCCDVFDGKLGVCAPDSHCDD